jgi:FkbM family methyltransferase
MRNILKKYVPEDSILYVINRKRFYYQQMILRKLFGFKYPSRWQFNVLDAYVGYQKYIKFVQIGANDGVVNDPLYCYLQTPGWEGVLVEPIPGIFKELVHNHSSSMAKLLFENTAICYENGIKKFYRLRREYAPGVYEWVDQLSSFKKEVVESHMGVLPGVQEIIEEVQINCISLTDLFNKFSIKYLNLLQIDTEGYDAEIIRMIPFETMNIDLIIFEHIHLSQMDYKQVLKLLNRYGYKVKIQNEYDTAALKKNLLKKIKP